MNIAIIRACFMGIVVLGLGCGTEHSSTRSTQPTDFYSEHNDFEFVNDEGSMDFIKYGSGIYGLAGAVKNDSIKICVSGASESRKPYYEEKLTEIVNKWMQPLRELSEDALTDQIEIAFGATTDCTATFRVVSGAWGYTYISNRPAVTVGPNVPYNVILHEFGHAFALGDTYQNGQSGNCKSRQPQSIMCNISFSDIQPDDIAGVSSVFKDRFGQ